MGVILLLANEILFVLFDPRTEIGSLGCWIAFFIDACEAGGNCVIGIVGVGILCSILSTSPDEDVFVTVLIVLLCAVVREPFAEVILDSLVLLGLSEVFIVLDLFLLTKGLRSTTSDRTFICSGLAPPANRSMLALTTCII